MAMFSNGRQHIPAQFRAVIANDAERAIIRDRFSICQGTVEDWLKVGELVRDRKNLRAGAELALRWNADKGNAAPA